MITLALALLTCIAIVHKKKGLTEALHLFFLICTILIVVTVSKFENTFIWGITD